MSPAASQQSLQALASAMVSFAQCGLTNLIHPITDPALLTQAQNNLPLLENSFASGAIRESLAAALWLAAGDLDHAHRICQDIPGPYGAAWHAVVHRREGDFWNSKYWWRRAEAIRWDGFMTRLGKIVQLPPGDQLKDLRKFISASRYDPATFVDLVAGQSEHPDAATEKILLQIQRAEWLALFEECQSPAAA